MFERLHHREAAGNQSTMVIRVSIQAAEMIDELWQRAETEYHAFLDGLKRRVREAQSQAHRLINTRLIELYWDT